MEKIYRPNIGWVFWLHLLLILCVILPIAILVLPGTFFVPIMIILMLILLTTLLAVARTMYTLEDERMVIQGSFKKYEVPYGSVSRIVDTNKGLVGEGMLVLSPDRIVVFYGEGSKVSISPRDKQDAMESLRSCCPGAEFEQDLREAVRKEAVSDISEDVTEDAIGENDVNGDDVIDDRTEFQKEYFPDDKE